LAKAGGKKSFLLFTSLIFINAFLIVRYGKDRSPKVFDI